MGQVGENSSPFSIGGSGGPCSVADKSRLSYARCRTSGWKRVPRRVQPRHRRRRRRRLPSHDFTHVPTTNTNYTSLARLFHPAQGSARDLNSSFPSFLPS